MKNELVIGFFIAALILSVLGFLFMEPQNENQMSEQEATLLLADAAQKIAPHLPMMMDNITRIDSIVTQPERVCIYSYTLLGTSKETFNSTRFITVAKPIMINAYKTREGLKVFRDLCVEIRHIYSDEQGVELARFSITPEDF